MAARTLRGEKDNRNVGNQGWEILPYVSIAMALILLSITAIHNPREFENHFAYRTFAELREANVSSKPLDYYKLTDKQKDRSVKGANLRGRSLRKASEVGILPSSRGS